MLDDDLKNTKTTVNPRKRRFESFVVSATGFRGKTTGTMPYERYLTLTSSISRPCCALSPIGSCIKLLEFVAVALSVVVEARLREGATETVQLWRRSSEFRAGWRAAFAMEV
jgi:hypothetical protein